LGEVLEKFHPLDRRELKIFFQDEARFGRMSTLYKCWCPLGIRPNLKKSLEREFTYSYTSIEPATGESFSYILPQVNNVSMKLYLEEMSEHYKENRIIIIMDSASFHGLSNLNNIDNIQILHLPAYSPELNPVESFWNYLRKNYFGNKYWKSIDELEIYLKAVLNDVHVNEKETLKSLTNFSWIN